MGLFRKKTPTMDIDGLATDVDVLREQQRLLQLQTLDRWTLGILNEQRRSRRWRIFFRFVLFAIIAVSLANTTYLIVTASSKVVTDDRHIGVVDVKGPIDADGTANADRIIKGLRHAVKNDGSTHVVLKINSPGGSPTESQRVYQEIRHLGSIYDKPIISVIGDMGASGAYYIAAATDDIYAAPSSLVGSVGVVAASFGMVDAIDKLGVERRLFTAGDNKAFLDPFSELPEEQSAFWQGVLTDTHEQFIADVKAGRGGRLDTSDTDALFSGLVWTGNQAVDLGLIDGVASFDEVMRRLHGEDDNTPTVLNYTPRENPFDLFGNGIIPKLSQMLSLSSSGPLRYEVSY